MQFDGENEKQRCDSQLANETGKIESNISLAEKGNCARKAIGKRRMFVCYINYDVALLLRWHVRSQQGHLRDGIETFSSWNKENSVSVLSSMQFVWNELPPDKSNRACRRWKMFWRCFDRHSFTIDLIHRSHQFNVNIFSYFGKVQRKAFKRIAYEFD